MGMTTPFDIASMELLPISSRMSAWAKAKCGTRNGEHNKNNCPTTWPKAGSKFFRRNLFIFDIRLSCHFLNRLLLQTIRLPNDPHQFHQVDNIQAVMAVC